MGHEPGPEWKKKRKLPMTILYSALQCVTIIIGIVMMSVSQGSIKGAYLENLNNPSSLPVGDISNALEIIKDWS